MTSATRISAPRAVDAPPPVVGDIGDGQVKCPEGIEEISRIQYGIEGGVCCKALPATAEAPIAS